MSQLSIRQFADLGIRGLSARNTVRKYRSRWEQAMECGWVDDAAPGSVVQLPAEPFGDIGKWEPATGLMTSATDQWYTPPRILAAVVAALDGIDFDPCAEPAKSVPAAAHYTEVENGLVRPWRGRVYMNPPYGRPIVEWIGKLMGEYHDGRTVEAVALVPARTETDWWQQMDAEWVCFVHGRLAFSGSQTSAPFPSAAIYLGPNGERFASAFGDIGEIYRRVRE